MGNNTSEPTCDLSSSEDSIPTQNDMDEVVCDICIQNYESEKIVPRVLECGHTLCSPCIEQLKKCSALCPKCRVPLVKSNYKDFPINYSLLGIADSLQQNKPTLLRYRIDKLTKKYAKTEVQLTKNLTKTESNLSCVSEGLARLRALGKQEANLLNSYHSTIQLLQEMNDELDVIRNESLKLSYSKYTVNIKLPDFADSSEFLFEIYNRAAKGEKLYAVTIAETKVKFARISVWANQIIIHAFGDPKEAPNLKTVWFLDIKSSLGPENFRAFLEICCNDKGMRQIVIVKTTNSSLVPQFLKFCSGEVGPVYMGACYFQGPTPNPVNYTPILKIPKFILKGEEQVGKYEYVSLLGTTTSYNKHDVLLTGSADGGLNIVQLLHSDYIPDVIGIIEEPQELSKKIVHGHDRRITDSGIIALV